MVRLRCISRVRSTVGSGLGYGKGLGLAGGLNQLHTTADIWDMAGFRTVTVAFDPAG